jgi:hypothetical protein
MCVWVTDRRGIIALDQLKKAVRVAPASVYCGSGPAEGCRYTFMRQGRFGERLCVGLIVEGTGEYVQHSVEQREVVSLNRGFNHRFNLMVARNEGGIDPVHRRTTTFGIPRLTGYPSRGRS